MSKFFSLTGAKKLRHGANLFQKKSGGEKILIGGGGYHDFLSKSFCLTREKFRWGTFRCIRKFRVSKEVMHQRGRGYHVSPSKTFVTQYRKFSLGNNLVYREFSGIENFYASGREGISHISVKNFLSHSIENFRWGTLRCIGKFRVWKNSVYQRGREYHISPSKNFVTQYQRISLGNTSVYREISGNEKFYA